MNLATPAPKVESAAAEPAPRNTSIIVEPASEVEEATAEPAQAVEAAETVDNPHKFAPSNALSHLQEKSKLGVQTLREQGVDFESRVGLVKGGAPKKHWSKLMFPLFFDQRDFVTFSEIARYAVIQGHCCFIFLEHTDLSPLYAFSLADSNFTAEIEDRDNPDKYSCTVDPCSNTNKTGKGLETVLLRNNDTNKIAYQFTFNTTKDPSVVKRFMEVVGRASSSGMAEATMAASKESDVKGKKKEGK